MSLAVSEKIDLMAEMVVNELRNTGVDVVAFPNPETFLYVPLCLTLTAIQDINGFIVKLTLYSISDSGKRYVISGHSRKHIRQTWRPIRKP